MHHAIAVGKELCLRLIWGMFIVFFQISTVIIYEYTDIPAFKFFAALHPDVYKRQPLEYAVSDRVWSRMPP